MRPMKADFTAQLSARDTPGTGPWPRQNIDWHAHLLSDTLVPPTGSTGLWPGIRESGQGFQLTLGGRDYRPVDRRTFDAARRLEDMNSWGVDVQVVSPPPYAVAFDGPVGELADLACQQNAFMAACVRQIPGRFAMFGMLPLGDMRLVESEMDRLESYPGVQGVCLAAYRHDELCHPRFLEFWRRIERNGWIVFIHPADTWMCSCDVSTGAVFGAGMPASTGRTATRLVMSGLLERVPDLKFLLAHGGGTFAAAVARLDHGWGLGMHPDLRLAPSTVARSAFWVDSVVYSAGMLGFIEATFGSDRVVYGSDYPFAALVEPSDLQAMASRKDTERIVGTNGSALWNLIQRRGDPFTAISDSREEFHGL